MFNTKENNIRIKFNFNNNLIKNTNIYFLTSIFLLALIIRIAYIIINKSYIDPEDVEYGLLARSLIGGHGYSISISGGPYVPSSNQAPIYPFFIAFFYYFSQNAISFLSIQIIQSIISAFTCLIIYYLGLKIFENETAILASLGMAVYPLFIHHSATINPAIFEVFFLSLSILFLYKIIEQPSVRNQILSGLLIGITALVTPIIILSFPLILIWIWLNANGTYRINIKRIIIISTLTLTVILPWTVRNYLVHNKFVLIRTLAGQNFWIGNNPNATGTDLLPSGKHMFSIFPYKENPLHPFTEIERDTILSKEAFRFIKENPTTFLMLTVKKLYYFWWFPPNDLVTEKAAKFKTLMRWPQGILILLAIIGIIVSIKKWKILLLFYFFFLTYSGVYSFTHVGHYRYKGAIIPCLILIGSNGLFFMVKYFYKILFKKKKRI